LRESFDDTKFKGGGSRRIGSRNLPALPPYIVQDALMIVAPTPADVRQYVAQAFRELSRGECPSPDLDEHIVVDGGNYVARSYHHDDLFAMWLIPVGLLQIYDDQGNMLRTINLLELRERQYKAA
jgi:hypothetical protein